MEMQSAVGQSLVGNSIHVWISIPCVVSLRWPSSPSTKDKSGYCFAGLPSPAYEALHEYEGLQDICQPSIHQTKAQCYKANKKRAKEERRSRRQASESIEPLVQATAMNYGDFEKHTRGIGSKLMAQMGYLGEGTGLGRDKQGMAEPLQALQRPKKLGLGA
jgi:hypothetical protein